MRYLSILFVLLILSCKEKNNSESSSSSYIVDGEYTDGTYCADVTYHNPNTGTTNTYTLNVEVEDNSVTEIHWPNGGSLDESHFSAEELDDSGHCSFTSDKGYEYEIQINGEECSSTDDISSDDEKSICPKCGEEKDEYDVYCYSCKRKIEDEEQDREDHTCKKCGSYDSFMFSTDDMCSSCKRREEEEEKERREQEEDN
jgi:hypothetical protein